MGKYSCFRLVVFHFNPTNKLHWHWTCVMLQYASSNHGKGVALSQCHVVKEGRLHYYLKTWKIKLSLPQNFPTFFTLPCAPIGLLQPQWNFNKPLQDKWPSTQIFLTSMPSSSTSKIFPTLVTLQQAFATHMIINPNPVDINSILNWLTHSCGLTSMEILCCKNYPLCH